MPSRQKNNHSTYFLTVAGFAGAFAAGLAGATFATAGFAAGLAGVVLVTAGLAADFTGIVLVAAG